MKAFDTIFIFQWNGSITYSFEIERDFGTDYGICCWHTPQHNITLIHQDMIEHNLSEVHWGEWFQDVKKVSRKSISLHYHSIAAAPIHYILLPGKVIGAIFLFSRWR